MTAKDYIKSGPIDLTYIAGKMWPGNKNAQVYLSMKLNDKRPWTEKDEKNASKILHDLGTELNDLFVQTQK